MQIKRKGLTLLVDEQDYYPNPREFNNMGTMICFHRRYNLGDEHEFYQPSDFQAFAEKNKKDIVAILPLYLYDHSGITMSTTPFNDIWDSGQVGYIYCTKEKAKANNIKGYEKIKEELELEVKQYDDYLQGKPKYFYFVLKDEDDNEIDSVFGFEGSKFKDVIREMKNNCGVQYHFLFDALLKKQENCL